MNPEQFRELAAYHEEMAETSLALSRQMLGPCADNFRRRSALHAGWAQGLRELVEQTESDDGEAWKKTA